MTATEFGSERCLRLSNFLDALEAEDVFGARDTLSLLGEIELDVSQERSLFQSLIIRIELEDAECLAHGVCDCPECVDTEGLFGSGDPIDGIDE